MSDIAFAIFASVVLYLAVTHKRFRKVVLWVGSACLLCAVAGGFYLWHRSRVEDAAKRTALAADDAVQNARIAKANQYDSENRKNPTTINKKAKAAELWASKVCDTAGPGRECHDATQEEIIAYGEQSGGVGEGNATTINSGAVVLLYSCDAMGSTDHVLTSVPDRDRVTVLRFGYEWGAYGNYGAKIQLADGLTGCILDGSNLKLDGE